MDRRPQRLATNRKNVRLLLVKRPVNGSVSFAQNEEGRCSIPLVPRALRNPSGELKLPDALSFEKMALLDHRRTAIQLTWRIPPPFSPRLSTLRLPFRWRIRRGLLNCGMQSPQALLKRILNKYRGRLSRLKRIFTVDR
jgi:hypothetical protein